MGILGLPLYGTRSMPNSDDGDICCGYGNYYSDTVQFAFDYISLLHNRICRAITKTI